MKEALATWNVESFCHILREANIVADTIAKYGLSMDGEGKIFLCHARFFFIPV